MVGRDAVSLYKLMQTATWLQVPLLYWSLEKRWHWRKPDLAKICWKSVAKYECHYFRTKWNQIYLPEREIPAEPDGQISGKKRLYFYSHLQGIVDLSHTG